jgi:hypothetical protein
VTDGCELCAEVVDGVGGVPAGTAALLAGDVAGAAVEPEAALAGWSWGKILLMIDENMLMYRSFVWRRPIDRYRAGATRMPRSNAHALSLSPC